MAPPHSHSSVKSRGKTLTQRTEEKGRRKEKATNYTGDRRKMNLIKGTRDLVPMREKTLVENLLSLRTNRHGDNQEPSNYVGNEQDGRQKKFGERRINARISKGLQTTSTPNKMEDKWSFVSNHSIPEWEIGRAHV